MKRFLNLLLASLFLSTQALADPELTLGIAVYRPKAVMQTQWQPLADYLSQSLPGYTIRLRILELNELDTAIQRQELDFAFTNPTHFIKLRAHNALSGALATLVTLEGRMPAAVLGGVIIQSSEQEPLNQLAQIKGKTIAAVDADALGGYVAQAAVLAGVGIKPEDLRVRFSGRPHDRIVEAVLTGQADIGFLRSGVIEQLSREGKLDPARLRILHRQSPPGFPFAVSTPLYPEWPFVALPRVGENNARRVATALLSLTPDHPASRAAGIHGFTIPADYAPVELAMRALRLPPFEGAPDFTWQDIWARHQISLTLLVLAAAAILLLIIRLATVNRHLMEARLEAIRTNFLLDRERLHLLTLVRTMPDMVWLKDAEGVYLGCNPRFERFFGAAEADIVGKTDYDFVDGKLADFFRDNDRKAMAKGRPSVNEEWLSFANDGHRELVETTKTPMFDAHGHLIGVLGIGHDITERRRIEEMLRQREHYQRALIDNFPFLVWLKDAEGRFLAVNKPFADACGLASPEVFTGKTDLDIWPHDLAESYRADDRAVLELGRSRNVEEMLETEGRRTWIETYKSPVAIDGQVIGTVGFSRDITERRNIETILEIQHQFTGTLVGNPGRDELLRAILDSALRLPGLDGGGLYWRQTDGGYHLILHQGLSGTFIHKVERLAADSPRAGLITQGRLQCSCVENNANCTDPELVHSDDLAREGILSLVVVPILANGAPVACLNLASKHQGTSAQTLAALETLARHFSRALERLQAQEEAEQQQRNITGLFDTIQDYLFVLDMDGRILHFNKAVEAGLGYDRHLLGQPVDSIYSAEVGGEAKRNLVEMMSGALTHCSLPIKKADGGRIAVDTLVTRGDWNGQPALFGIARDMSDRGRVEEMQRFSAFQAGVAEMGVSVLHNIGNAITSVVSDTNAVSRSSEELARVAVLLERNCAEFSDRMGPDGLDADQSGHLLAIQRQAAATIQRLYEQGLAQRSRRINDSVQHIADIVRIQQSASVPSTSVTAFALHEALLDALAMHGDTLKQHGIRFEVAVDPELGQVSLSRNRLLQAMLNVMKNAYDAIREREGEAGFQGMIQVRAEAVDPGWFRIRVKDNGIGIAREQQASLFRFGYSTKARGSGFGLHATALFVQELDGVITLESDGPGQGATLSMTLPRSTQASGNTDVRPVDCSHGSRA